MFERWLNTQPPIWDMAYHQLQGFHYLDLQRGQFTEQFAQLSTYYTAAALLSPGAVILHLVGYTQWLPLLSNVVGLYY